MFYVVPSLLKKETTFIFKILFIYLLPAESHSGPSVLIVQNQLATVFH